MRMMRSAVDGSKLGSWKTPLSWLSAPTTAGKRACARGESTTLIVKGRRLIVPRAGCNVAWFGFADLCAKPLAAPDYLAVTERFAAVVVEAIPRLTPQQRNEARRFSILIDTLYEARTLQLASAEAPPEEIYPAGDGSFDFQRTVSRLIEMQSEDYIANRPRR